MAEEAPIQPIMQPQQYANPVINQLGSSVLTLTDPSDNLFRLECTLRGIILDENDQPKYEGQALMNDEGIGNVMGTAQSIVNRVTHMSNLESKEISALMELLADTIIRDLMINRVRYSIKNGYDRSKIVQIVITESFMCLKRGWHGGERHFLKGSVQEYHTRVDAPSQRRGLFSHLNPFK